MQSEYEIGLARDFHDSKNVLGPVHTNPDEFENVSFFRRFGQPSHLSR